MASLLTIAKLTHEALAGARGLKKEAVTMSVRQGPRIRLSTLAAYAKAAGYTLWLIANGVPGWALRAEVDERHTMSVEEARIMIEGWGLQMELAVEPAEGGGG